MVGRGAWAPRRCRVYTGLCLPVAGTCACLRGHPVGGGKGSLSGMQFEYLEPSTMKILGRKFSDKSEIETKQSCVRCVCKQEHGKTNSDITGVPEACIVKGQEAQSNVPRVLYLRGGRALSPPTPVNLQSPARKSRGKVRAIGGALVLQLKTCPCLLDTCPQQITAPQLTRLWKG